MKKVLFILTFLILISFVSANIETSIVASSAEITGQKIPGVLGKVFKNENVNFHVAKNDGTTVVIGLVTEDKIVKSLSVGELEKPSLNVYIDENTLTEMTSSNNPFPVLEKAMDDGRVTYKAVGFMNKIKFAFLGAFSSIVKVFTSEPEYEALPEESEEEAETPETPTEEPEVDPEPKPAEEPEQTETEEFIEEVVEAIAEETIPEPEPEPEGPKTHVIEMKSDGFEPKDLKIELGDTVTWKNVRAGENIEKSMVVGAQRCYKIKSGFMEAGDTYTHTFDEAGKCTFVDGIITTLISSVTVE